MGKKISTRARRARTGREGFSLIEVTILALLLLVAVGGLSGAVLSSMRLSRVTEESSLADEAARALAAQMQVTDFGLVFRTYNASTLDDAGLAAPVPGAAFDLRGLAPRRDDADGRVGRIEFPVVDAGGGVLLLDESFVEPRLGMLEGVGRDLNLDGDAQDQLAVGYQSLPVRVIVEWTGAAGNRSYELDLVMMP